MENIPQKVIVQDWSDSIGVALVPIWAGEVLNIKIGTETRTVRIQNDIPRYHKFAVIDLPGGAEVLKNGEVIGRLLRETKIGEHVHTHNLTGLTMK
ncbi:UxaA family hydrolase [Oricola indica]|jgi:altronate dehydratase small subunit|uniref:UxaA family hydrolase n=1 Tax=Oricola indica TaxID=2872591 RepID=UPI001CBF4DC0|nr:UxaA family hydrolase [Oricola indica]